MFDLSNEILFVGFLAFALMLPVVFYWLGKSWMYVFVAINGCALIVMAPMQATVFGFVISLSTIYWAPLYLVTDMLAETYGKRAAMKAVLVNILTSYVFVLLIHVPLMFEPTASSSGVFGRLEEVFQHSWRMTIVGTAVFFVSQWIDVHVYDYLHKKTGEKFLWLRNNASTLFTSFIANVGFWGLALGHILDNWFVTAMASLGLM